MRIVYDNIIFASQRSGGISVVWSELLQRALRDAALDLGCNPTAAFFRVVMPEILPGVVTGSLMAFTISSTVSWVTPPFSLRP